MNRQKNCQARKETASRLAHLVLSSCGNFEDSPLHSQRAQSRQLWHQAVGGTSYLDGYRKMSGNTNDWLPAWKRL